MQKKSDRPVFVKSRLPRQMFHRQSQVPKTESKNFSGCESSPKCTNYSTLNDHEQNYWKDLIGQPVCIGGVKEGLLRYYGQTKFANGIWCGVELNEPVGKHNGTVNGVTYFTCKPNHGIFAPVSKVACLNLQKLESKAENDQNFYQKCRRPSSFHEEYKNINCVKQSSSDPNFQAQHAQCPCMNCEKDGSTWFGDKRCLTEQRETNPLSQNNKSYVKSQFFLPFEKLKPFASITSSSLSDTSKLVSSRKNIQHTFDISNSSPVHQNISSISDYSKKNHSPSVFYPYSTCISGNITEEKFSKLNSATSYQMQTRTEDQSLHYIESNYSEAKMSQSQTSETKDDDDDLSQDYDESLGILSPSQMKDFTLCGDLSTSCSEIARAVDFPSSESFDDVNELPEDEIAHDVSIQYMSSGPSSVISSVTVTQSDIVDSVKTQHMLRELKHNVNSRPLSCTEQFLLNVSSDSVADVHFKLHSVDSLSPINAVSTSVDPNTNKQAIDVNLPEESLVYSDPESITPEILEINFSVETTLNPNIHISPEESTQCYKTDDITHESIVQNKDVLKETSFIDTPKSSNNQEEFSLKERVSVSWDADQIPDKTVVKDERPESIYTVSSCDTGYQDDGEEDIDGAMTASVESTKENKKASVMSRDSGVMLEDMDPLKAVESASTSGYSTGLSDSYYNDRPEEECSRPFMEDSYRDVQDSYHSDDGLLDAPMSSSMDENIGAIPEKSGFFDMDSYKDSEANSEFQITESNTILGLNATCRSFTEDENDLASANTTLVNDDTITKDSVPHEDSKTPKKEELLNDSKTCPPSSPEKKINESKKTGIEKNESDAKLLRSPKRKVMCTIKSVIQNSTNKMSGKNKVDINEQEKKITSVRKQSRWGTVTSKIAASLADEKSKPKTKRDVKSKVDTNLAAARQACKSPKSEHSGFSEKISRPTLSPKSRKMQHENQYHTGWCSSTHSHRVEQNYKSPRPSKTCCSSRSASPVAVSECSTASHTTSSHHSRSKIAIWKGSNNAVAAPVTTPQGKKSFIGGTLKLMGRTNKVQNKDMTKDKQVTNKTTETSTKSVPTRLSTARQESAPKTQQRFKSAKEQHGHEGRPIVPPKPVRPPMWLSKAELTQEIQHLSSLCETRTKELNRLKMQTKYVTSGFDALAVAIRYMSEDLKAFENPCLLSNLKQTQEKVDKEKKDLECYEKKIASLNNLHAKEMNEMLETLTLRHESAIQELILKHTTEMNFLQEQHKKEISSFADALSASCEEEKLQQQKLIEDLQKELKQQREEVEMFHQQELDDLEERYKEEQQLLKEEIKKLQKQLAEAKQSSSSIEETLQKDTDAKLHWLAEKKNDLQKEVDSLKAVLEIKNNELHTLRKENLEMQKELEELPLAKEKIKMLQARAEDLQALMSEKVSLERSLSNECKIMRESFEVSERVVKRLSMENEELQWRLKEVSESSLLLPPATEDICETNSAEELNLSDDMCGFEEELTPSAKTSSPLQAPKPIFFTYMNEEELALSPGMHYKPIKPCPPSSYKSPSRLSKSSSPSPRKSKGSADNSPHCGGGTPRKMAKHLSSQNSMMKQKMKISDAHGKKLPGITNSLLSSTSSDNSVFEEHDNHRENTEFDCDVPSPNYDDSNWKSPASTDQMESVDPKTFYHVAFPVMKESESTHEADKIAKELSETK